MWMLKLQKDSKWLPETSKSVCVEGSGCRLIAGMLTATQLIALCDLSETKVQAINTKFTKTFFLITYFLHFVQLTVKCFPTFIFLPVLFLHSVLSYLYCINLKQKTQKPQTRWTWWQDSIVNSRFFSLSVCWRAFAWQTFSFMLAAPSNVSRKEALWHRPLPGILNETREKCDVWM